MDSTIRDICDCAMTPFEKSDIRINEQEKIARDIESLGNRLSADCKEQYTGILDDINTSDSAAYYEAFRQGMIVAMKIFSQNELTRVKFCDNVYV